MSSEFTRFSEAARLYAKHIKVVEEMEEAFANSLRSFLDAVRDRLAADAGDDLKFGEARTEKYRYWWVEDEETAPKRFEDLVPYVYVQSLDPRMIEPGLLKLTADADVDDPGAADRRRLATARNELRLPDKCRVINPSGPEFFEVEIAYGEEDPVATVAKCTMPVLKALNDAARALIATKKVGTARTKGGR